MNSRNPRRRPPRPISDDQHRMIADMYKDAEVRLVPAEIRGFYERAIAGEPVTQRETQRIIDTLREHAKPGAELPLNDKQLWWIERHRDEAAADAAATLTRDQFPRLVLETLAAIYGTAEVDEIMELPLPTVKKWSDQLISGASLIFGSAQRDRQRTLVQAAATAHDLQAPMKRLHKDLAAAAARADDQQAP